MFEIKNVLLNVFVSKIVKILAPIVIAQKSVVKFALTVEKIVL